MTADEGHRFARLVIAAVETPAAVNPSALLEAASAFLDTSPADDRDGLALARRMAFRAMDWAVFGTPETYNALTRAAHAFRMISRLKTSA